MTRLDVLPARGNAGSPSDAAALAMPSRHDPDCSTRDGSALASVRVSGVLALEIAKSGWRPKIERELRDLIRRMSKENPLWGAPRIHGELRKLGFELAQSTVSKYPPPAALVCGDAAADGGVAGAIDYRGISMGFGASLSGAR